MVSDALTEDERCDRFRQIVNDRFRFLITTYGFASVESGCMGGEMWVVFRSNVSQVDVYFAYRQTNGSETGESVWVTVGRANGERFNLDDLLHLRASRGEGSRLFAGFDPELVDQIVKVYSDELREYADDLLRGDFSLFPRLREVMNERNRRWAHE